MDETSVEETSKALSFAQEIGMSFAKNTAAATGMFVGAALTTSAIRKVRERRFEKKQNALDFTN